MLQNQALEGRAYYTLILAKQINIWHNIIKIIRKWVLKIGCSDVADLHTPITEEGDPSPLYMVARGPNLVLRLHAPIA